MMDLKKHQILKKNYPAAPAGAVGVSGTRLADPVPPVCAVRLDAAATALAPGRGDRRGARLKTALQRQGG
ncbi:protein of unknown function [Candidatus Hydrogenisulfobacillus filiaventi]|uniref:Uncharacterized protein n=1 Tax=Candidatus Hydrogenisulfobacillus filiaventi TaxID=2707344 RepID=A0A6F8ZDP6_9FIRM|nr:protein of unknown function [Candidatus Hydrogenisulfobacillus filiaventi]